MKDDTGPADYNAAQPNGQPWPNLQAAHEASPYRRLGDRRYVAATGLLRFDIYEYQGLTKEENADISFLRKRGSSTFTTDITIGDPNYGFVVTTANGSQVRMTVTDDLEPVFTKIN